MSSLRATNEPSTPLHRYVSYAAQCEDGSIWGLYDPYSTSVDSGYGPSNAPQGILQLYPDFKPDPIATITQDRMVIAGTALHCYNKVLYYIIDNYKPEITDPVGGGPGDHDGSTLVSYDTVSGKIEQRNITGDWAIRITDEMWGGTILKKYAYKGGLYWILVNGDVVRTDLETAHNTMLFTLEGFDPEAESPGLIYFEGDYLFQSIPRFGADTDFYRYNLITKKMESHAKIPDYKNVEKKYQFPTDMVITNLDKALKL